MTTGPAFPALVDLDDLTTRILELAAEELHPERTTLEVTGYADGDYAVRAFETLSIEPDPDRDGQLTERAAVGYDRHREWIQFHRYRETGDRRKTLERRDLEPYADPVTAGAEQVVDERSAE